MEDERKKDVVIHARVVSDTIRIPELGAFIGKDVEIIVRECTPMSKEQVAAFLEAGKHIDIDLDELMKLREASKI